MTNPSDDAFPTPSVWGGEDDVLHEREVRGLSFREHAAIQIMAGFAAMAKVYDLAPDAPTNLALLAASSAVRWADALIEALNAKG